MISGNKKVKTPARHSTLNGEAEIESERKRRQRLLLVVRSAIMAALVAVATFIVQIPVSATGGYINFGDIMIFISALALGPIVGGLAGSIGSAISDIASGYAATFAPFTFIIKGIEGFLAGLISNRKSTWRDIIAVVLAGSEMIAGYFLAEVYPLHLGMGAALIEVPGNTLQIAVGAIIGIPTTWILRKRLPKSWTA